MMTFLAPTRRSAASSVVVSCTFPCGVAGPALALTPAPSPNPAKTTFQIDRFIARHMM